MARPYVKLALRLDTLESIPFLVERAVRAACYGRPGTMTHLRETVWNPDGSCSGAVYLDLPGDIVNASVVEPIMPALVPAPPRSCATGADIAAAVKVLQSSKKPLVIVGKGCAYACAEHAVGELVASAHLPFIPTPMGKVLLDTPCCVLRRLN